MDLNHLPARKDDTARGHLVCPRDSLDDYVDADNLLDPHHPDWCSENHLAHQATGADYCPACGTALREEVTVRV